MFKFNGFTPQANDAVNLAMTEAGMLGHTYIGSEHLLYGLLKEGHGAAYTVLSRKNITADDVQNLMIRTVGRGLQSRLTPADFTPRCKRILERSVAEASSMGSSSVGTEHILMSLLKEKDCYAVRFLRELNIDCDYLYRSLNQTVLFGTEDNNKKNPSNNKKKENGKSPLLERYGRDLTQLAHQQKLDPVIGRDKEIQRVIQILSRRTKNNPCLIGEAGVGKTAVAEGLAQMIVQGEVPENLEGKRLISLDLVAMIAGTKYRGEFEERVKNAVEEVISSDNIILFIDEIHTIIGAGAAEGAIDAANILKPQLARGELQLIGATTLNEYRRHIEKDYALERRFQTVMIEEPSEQQAIEILQGLREKYETYHKIHITDRALESAVRLSARYLNDRFLPDKAIDLIDEAASRVRLTAFAPPEDVKELEAQVKKLRAEKEAAINSQDFEGAAAIRDEEQKLKKHLAVMRERWQCGTAYEKREVTEKDIADVISDMTGIDATNLTKVQSEQLLEMESIISRQIIGQDHAVRSVVKAIRRGKVGLNDPRRPIASFIFLGPTGVGKTQLCKVLAAQLFGTEDAMIRLDMSEYMEKHTVSKIIGSPPGYVGYDEGGQLTEKVRRKPYSVVLLDEIEKAHPDVFNLLLQILEDGFVTDSQGKKVNFRNTVIIMTSNIGARVIFQKNDLGFGIGVQGERAYESIRREVLGELKNHFSPEFINRVDELIVFNKLTEKNMEQIVRNMLAQLTKRMAEQNIQIEYTPELVQQIAQEGYDPVYGARPLRRKIQSCLEDVIADEILQDAFQAGDRICADYVDGEYKLTKSEPLELKI